MTEMLQDIHLMLLSGNDKDCLAQIHDRPHKLSCTCDVIAVVIGSPMFDTSM